jgi:carbonic anhydrase
MHITRRSLIHGTAGLALSSMLPLRAWADGAHGTRLAPAQALANLIEGNRKFAAGEPRPPFDITQLKDLAKGQEPWATIVCCSDSRVPPELIFRTGLGELFVVRNAGNTAASAQSLGSIEYSVAPVGVPLIVVLGHSDCGALKAATAVVDSNATFNGSIGPMVDPLVPAALAARSQPGVPLDNGILENVRRVTARLRSPEQPILYPPQLSGKLQIWGAVYDIASGQVHYTDIPPGLHLPAVGAAQH